MNRRNSSKFMIALLLIVVIPSVCSATSVYFDYAGTIGNGGGTYSAFLEFSSMPNGPIGLADVVNSAANYQNTASALHSTWDHVNFISFNGLVTGGTIQRLDMDWYGSPGDTNIGTSGLQWAVGLGPSQTGTYFNDVGTGAWTIRPQASVPEPSTLLLLGSGLVGLAAWRRKHAA